MGRADKTGFGYFRQPYINPPNIASSNRPKWFWCIFSKFFVYNMFYGGVLTTIHPFCHNFLNQILTYFIYVWSLFRLLDSNQKLIHSGLWNNLQDWAQQTYFGFVSLSVMFCSKNSMAVKLQSCDKMLNPKFTSMNGNLVGWNIKSAWMRPWLIEMSNRLAVLFLWWEKQSKSFFILSWSLRCLILCGVPMYFSYIIACDVVLYAHCGHKSFKCNESRLPVKQSRYEINRLVEHRSYIQVNRTKRRVKKSLYLENLINLKFNSRF